MSWLPKPPASSTSSIEIVCERTRLDLISVAWFTAFWIAGGGRKRERERLILVRSKWRWAPSDLRLAPPFAGLI